MPAVDPLTGVRAPVILIVADLGKPSVEEFAWYFEAILDVWASVKDPLDDELDRRGRSGEMRRRVQGSRLRALTVERVSLASPLEMLLSGAASHIVPIAYTLTAMAVLERAVRLLMDWQNHRLTLEQQERGWLRPGSAEELVSELAADVPYDQEAMLKVRRAFNQLGQYKIIAVERDSEIG